MKEKIIKYVDDNEKLKASILTICFMLVGFLIIKNLNGNNYGERIDEPIRLEWFDNKEPTIENVLLCIKYYNIHNEDIVLAQSLLETGYYKSKNWSKSKNNLFGIIDAKSTRKSGKFVSKRYNHWYESVRDYKLLIQVKYKEGEDYYKFLKRINYATDPLYITKIKKIVKRHENDLILKKHLYEQKV